MSRAMRKIIAVSAILVMLMFITLTAYADSVSKIIRLTLRVVSEAEIEDSHRTVVRYTVEEVDEEPVFDIVYRGY